MIIASSIIVVLFICSIRFKKSPVNGVLYNEGYSISNTNSIKGLLSLFIVLSHLAGKTDYALPLFGFSAMGAIGVGCFFFLSGYSLVVSAKNKKSYFKGFLYNRYKKILVPYIIMVFLYVILICFLCKTPLEDIINSFICGYPISNSWYVFACLYCYFLFWIFFRKSDMTTSKYKPVLLVLAGIVFYIIVTAFILKWGGWWYKTIICFPLGLAFALYQDAIKRILNKYYPLFLIIFVLFAIFSYCFPAIYNKFLGFLTTVDKWLINEILLGLSFSLLLSLLLYKIHFTNRITTFIGNISYEIYLYHGLVMNFLATELVSFPMETHFQQELYSILVLIVSIVVAFTFNKTSKFILKHI